MPTRNKQKLASPINSRVPIVDGTLAEKVGREVLASMDEAFASRKCEEPRPHVMVVYDASHQAFDPVYKKLAA